MHAPPSPILALLSLTFALACAQPPTPAPEPSPPAPSPNPELPEEPSPTPGEPVSCAGPEDTPCPLGLVCVDDPNDDCLPENSELKCNGVCVEASECEAPPGSGKRYLGNTPEICARIRFRCEEGEEPFFDDCGCGCAPAP